MRHDRAFKIGTPEVSTAEVGDTEVRTLEVGTTKVCTPYPSLS